MRFLCAPSSDCGACWCARAKQHERMRNALDLLSEIGPPAKRYRVIEAS
jgi:hypothetical protein